MLNYLWSALVVLSILCSFFTGNSPRLSEAIIESSAQAIVDDNGRRYVALDGNHENRAGKRIDRVVCQTAFPCVAPALSEAKE